MMPDLHDLKIWPGFFDAVESGVKSFDLRIGDRDYKVNDMVVFREWDPEKAAYTGRATLKRIVFLLQKAEPFGLKPGFVVLGLR